ncbi:MAG TPA: histidine triad nucleotide-binding protein [Anaerolineales bacterium]|nr:histidine triad nucleotide-binding protein [Anaerolineae bacterium]HIQ02183.1 histidine triad nucleotide-binding protein [Anaerolineales bacterium]
MSDCIFCRIVQGQAPARILYRDDEVTAFHDLHPQAPVHLLIVPNRHIAGVAEVGPGDEPMLGKLFIVARRLAEEMDIGDGYRLVVNSGPLAGQSVFHLHLHLLGGRPFRWPPG